jgi:hypothetical protein
MKTCAVRPPFNGERRSTGETGIHVSLFTFYFSRFTFHVLRFTRFTLRHASLPLRP